MAWFGTPMNSGGAGTLPGPETTLGGTRDVRRIEAKGEVERRRGRRGARRRRHSRRSCVGGRAPEHGVACDRRRWPRRGSTLTASTGTWANSPTSFAYQWQRCASDGTGCGDVSGATDKTYTPTSGDVSHTIRVVVTATNADGKASASSDPTAVVGSKDGPANTVKPTVTGTAIVGEQLRVGNGTLDAGADVGLTAMAALQRRRRRLSEHLRRDRRDLRRPLGRRRQAVARARHGSHLEWRDDGGLEHDRRRGRSDHHGDHHDDGPRQQGAVHRVPVPAACRSPRLCAVPGLRRPHRAHQRHRTGQQGAGALRPATLRRDLSQPCRLSRSWVPAARFRGQAATSSRCAPSTGPAADRLVGRSLFNR